MQSTLWRLGRSALLLFTITVNVIGWLSGPVLAQENSAAPRINVPYWAQDTPYPSRSIAWFGKVSPTTNYVDIRTIYREDVFKLELHIIDRQLWRDLSPSAADLTAWDAVSLYLDLAAGDADAPHTGSMRFVKQLWDEDSQAQAGYRWDGSEWTASSLPIEATTGWRGDYPNTAEDDKGWTLSIVIPFADLGLSGPPPFGTVWRLGIVLHDRDDGAGSAIPDQTWPANLDTQRPSTWGQLHFGIPSPALQAATVAQGSVSIRQGVNNTTVRDAHVGGHTTCGDGIDHWSEWGEANYAGYSQFNIQNQWDISDYPCFSKYYVTFPLDQVPADKTVISATVTLYLFGNPGYKPGDSKPSMIEALTVAGDWDESTINWNNAPLPTENLGGQWVLAVDFFDPGVPYTWDVSRAAAAAHAQGQPLRLSFYSADGEYHSGKYFWSSDADEAVRPLLQIAWAESTDGPDDDPDDGADNVRIWLPLLTR